MNQHRILRLSYWLLLAIVLQLITVAPASRAQDDLTSITAPTTAAVAEAATPTAHMTYQPDPNADVLADFQPPTAATLIAAGTFPTVPITTTNPVSASVTLPQTDALVSFAAGQVAVVVEGDTLPTASALTFTPRIATEATEGGTLDNPASSQTLLRFHLDVTANNTLVTQFEKPVRLIVDLRALTANLNPAVSHRFFLAYQDETDPSVWHDVPLRLHQADGLLSAEVSHFSEWAAGVRPTYWTPTFTPAVPNAFSGSASYSYPIEVPPGRNGLQPGISLSYNSRQLDGHIQDVDAGTVAHGWSIAEIAIFRDDVRLVDTDANHTTAPEMVHPDKFSLVLNGSSHDLYPEANVNTTTAVQVRYYAKDDPSLAITRTYDISLPTDGLYWTVTTADGTLYRLGYTTDAEKWQQGSQRQIWGHQGHVNDISAIAWYVDTVTDVYGNQMQYRYYTHPEVEQIDWIDADEHDQYWLMTTQRVRLDNIRYNYPNLAATPPSASTQRLTSTPATRIEFRKAMVDQWDLNTDPIENIYVYHNSSNPIREYRISAHGETRVSTQCVNADPVPAVGRETHTYVVTAIQQVAGSDSNPLTSDGWGLPATTFGYTTLRHYGDDCFSFVYMNEVHNGYGGSTRFTYTSDGRTVDDYVYVGYQHYLWPSMGLNYFVTQTRSNDGRNADVVTDYSYTGPCYGQYDTIQVGTMTDATICGTDGAPTYGNLVGFATTTETHYAYDGSTVLNRQTSSFSRDAATTLGRPTQVDVQDGSGTLLTSSSYEYVSEDINNVPNMFTYTSRVTNTQYDDDLGSTSQSTKVEYQYNTGYQLKPNGSGGQFGQLTHILEYDDAAAAIPYRTTERWYRINNSSGEWTINQVSETVYSGSVGGEKLSQTWLYYDGQNTTPANTTIHKGAVTRARQFLIDPNFTCSQVPNGGGGSGCTVAYRTVEQTMTYDSYGNVQNLTSYGDYGYQTQDTVEPDINYNLRDVQPTAARTTQTIYDGTYHLYPVSVTTLMGTTTFAVYGFGGEALSGFQKQTGLLKSATGPDSPTTKYEYDPFGRLFAVYDGDTTYDINGFAGFGDTDPMNGDPVTRYSYWDNTWNSSTRFLEPGSNAPFLISVQQRPGSYASPSDASSGYAYNEQTFYDGFGRPIQTRSLWNWIDNQTRSREIISSTAYNALGQVSCQTIPYDVPFYSDRIVGSGNWPYDVFINESCTSKAHTTTTYDALGRPLVVTAPDLSQTIYSYAIWDGVTIDGRSHLALTNIQDANDHIVGQLTNSLGQLVLVQENEGSSTPYTAYSRTWYYYDSWGNLARTVTSDGTVNSDPTPAQTLRQTTMTYDNLGRKVDMTDADMGDWSYAYDAAGNLKAQIDANEHRLCFDYDSLNRLTDKWDDATNNGCGSGDTLLASYTYYPSGAGTGKVGQVSAIQWDGSGQNGETFDYNNLGQLITHTRTIDGRLYTMSYGNYDALGRAHTTTYPDGDVVTTSYDHEGENSLSSSLGGDMVDAIAYNAQGQMTTFARTDMGTSTYDYYLAAGSNGNSNFRLKTIQHGADNDNLPDFTYTYDPVGNVKTIAEHLNTDTYMQNFGYDHLNRLLTSSGTGIGVYNFSYEYDELGNITNYAGRSYQYDEVAWNSSCTAPTQDMPHAVRKIGSDYFCYDRNGNMTKRVMYGSTYLQTFNVENELSSVTVGGNTTHFSYDASGIRVKTVQPDGTILYTPFPNYEEEVPLPALPTVQLSASSSTIRPAENVVLNWSSSNASGCTATGEWNPVVGLSGQATVPPPSGSWSIGTHTFTLTCHNAAGTATQSVVITVVPPPTLTLMVNGSSSILIGRNKPFTLAWSSTYAAVCTATNAWSGSKPVNGSAALTSATIYNTYTYTLTCSNVLGDVVSRSVTVQVVPPPTLTFTVNEQESIVIAPDTAYTLAWSSQNATSCTEGEAEVSRALSGSYSTSQSTEGIYLYTMICSNSSDSVSQSVTVKVVDGGLSMLSEPNLAEPVTAVAARPQGAMGTQELAASLISLPKSTHTARTGHILAFVPPTGQTITIYAAGVGGPTMELRIDHQTVATFANVQGNPGQRQFLTFTYQHPTPVTAEQVEVAFINDATGRDLYVDKITLDGVVYESEATTTYSTGTYSSGTECDDAYKQSEVLNCNGFFRYGIRIQRSTYMSGGQVVAVRVSGDPVTANNGLHYLYSDHLGSASAILKDADNSTPIITRYMPFGDYRPGSSPNDITDLGFTGQKENMDLGLMYYNARYYAPGLGRFISADTIVPDPTDPQSFNRYSYTRNNPMGYKDPSGHDRCGSIGEVCDDEPPLTGSRNNPQVSPKAVKVVNTINFWGNTASAYPLAIASNYETVVSTSIPGVTANGVKYVNPYGGMATGLAHVGPIVTGITNGVTINNRQQSGEITEFEAGLERGANVGITLGNIGGTILIGEGGVAVGTIAAGSNPATWIFGATTIGTIAFAYDINVLQGTVNNLIEGEPFTVAFYDARTSVTDSYFGAGTQQALDQIINHYWPESVNESVANIIISIFK